MVRQLQPRRASGSRMRMVSIATPARQAASCQAPKLHHLMAAPPLENRIAAAMIFDRGPRSKIIAAAILFSSGGAAIKWCSFGAWQLAACRAGVAMLTILILLPEARRGWSWRTIVVGFAYA